MDPPPAELAARDGVWIRAVTRDGSVLKRGKAHNWIGGYHDTRAIVKLGRAFGGLDAAA